MGGAEWLGSGEAGCMPAVPSCAESNGGCDVHSNCTDTVAGPECGPCARGYHGSGRTSCRDTDACFWQPCFPGVPCTDLPPPTERAGFTCGHCPEGYVGDGIVCTLCALQLHLDATANSQKTVYRAYSNKLRGTIGISNQSCVNNQGVVFQWSGASSTGDLMLLTAERNQANTLLLTIPKHSFELNTAYLLQLRARFRGNPQ
ncbi:hypothetical protein CYMTET_32161, partial [Cymbomonas tetramitiformis]